MLELAANLVDLRKWNLGSGDLFSSFGDFSERKYEGDLDPWKSSDQQYSKETVWMPMSVKHLLFLFSVCIHVNRETMTRNMLWI